MNRIDRLTAILLKLRSKRILTGQEIADHFASESKRYKSNNQIEQALNAIQQGLNVMPEHTELLLLQEEHFDD